MEQEIRADIHLSWESPSRLFKKRDTEFFRNIAAIVFLLLIILIFAREFALILAVLAVVFLIYVFSTVPPEEVTHTITNLGIESASHYYKWEDLEEFWFEEQWGQVLLVCKQKIGPRLIILLSDQKQTKVRELLAKYIPYRELPEKNFVDNAASWLSEKIPLEKPS